MTILDSRLKPPAVAGTFYPADPGALDAALRRMMAEASGPALAPKAIAAPHAGYAFSGPVAASAFRLVADRAATIRRVVLLGPSHFVPFRGLALSGADGFATPLGVVPVDRAAQEALLGMSGVAVNDAAFAREHGIEVELPFLQMILDDFAVVPIVVGDAGEALVADVLRRLWGGPETLILISTDLSHFHAYAAARELDAACAKSVELLEPGAIADQQACGRIPLKGLLQVAREHDLRPTTVDLRNSGDTQGGRDRVVGYGAFAFEYAHAARLGADERRQLIDTAKWAVRFGLEKGRAPRVSVAPGNHGPLTAHRAAFVTLTLDGALRGCIGSLAAHQPLIADVAGNAYKAAFGDPRFKPLTPEEAERIEVSVSVLSTPRPIAAASEAELIVALRPDADGLIIQDGDRRGIFLPSVWSGIPDPRAFLHQLQRKAGMAPGHWSDGFRAFRFSTESVGAP